MCVVVVWFPFCGDGCGGFPCVFCECVVVLVDSCSVLFRFLLAFGLAGCCAFFVLGLFVACPFVSAISLYCIRCG